MYVAGGLRLDDPEEDSAGITSELKGQHCLPITMSAVFLALLSIPANPVS